MDSLVWIAAAALFALVTHLAIAGYLYWKREELSSAPTPVRNREEKTAGKITCPACETENDSFYRYCRNCVADLSTTAVATRDGSRTGARG